MGQFSAKPVMTPEAARSILDSHTTKRLEIEKFMDTFEGVCESTDKVIAEYFANVLAEFDRREEYLTVVIRQHRIKEQKSLSNVQVYHPTNIRDVLLQYPNGMLRKPLHHVACTLINHRKAFDMFTKGALPSFLIPTSLALAPFDSFSAIPQPGEKETLIRSIFNGIKPLLLPPGIMLVTKRDPYRSASDNDEQLIQGEVRNICIHPGTGDIYCNTRADDRILKLDANLNMLQFTNPRQDRRMKFNNLTGICISPSPYAPASQMHILALADCYHHRVVILREDLTYYKSIDYYENSPDTYGLLYPVDVAFDSNCRLIVASVGGHPGRIHQHDPLTSSITVFDIQGYSLFSISGADLGGLKPVSIYVDERDCLLVFTDTGLDVLVLGLDGRIYNRMSVQRTQEGKIRRSFLGGFMILGQSGHIPFYSSEGMLLSCTKKSHVRDACISRDGHLYTCRYYLNKYSLE
eukprot:TRINITY_DN2746_c0_g1_i5.p1 TRINITY_DN2746_c0_g1~~TRINITY_DN2746_c0_g1_i5.p1  ORF type:complete len:464 (-),score=78.00 TRINITY_DN2746_c0_g1_i5:212-1603(-)